ncbi:hypothetical protein GCM10017687_28870 [Streptomyces echinatus]
MRRMVGREGKLTERLETGACEGSWATAIDNSNALVDDLVWPVSEVGRVLTAVAEGDLSRGMELRTQAPDGGSGHPLRGEFLKVGRTVNNLVDQLSTFTDEVTRVASEVGTEGKLGGQARCAGCRFVEGPDRVRQHDGVPVDRTGEGHRAGDHGGRQG